MLLAFGMQISSSSEQRVSIKAPGVVMAGQSIRVVCTVPRHESNRGVTAAVVLRDLPDPFRSSYDQLDGAQSRITHPFVFERIPCDAIASVCVLEAQGEKEMAAVSTLQVGGCDQ